MIVIFMKVIIRKTNNAITYFNNAHSTLPLQLKRFTNLLMILIIILIDDIVQIAVRNNIAGGIA